MDVIPRIQPTDPAGVTCVDSTVMRMCATGVLVHGVTVRHLQGSVDGVDCAITITVNGTPFTTSAILPQPETEEEGVTDAIISAKNLTTTSTASSEQSDAWRHAATYKMSVDGLQMLFPGTRLPSRDMGNGTVTTITNPREFPQGVQVTIHSADREHVYGSALCKTSGEPASLSTPRGEVCLHFRVYPCVNGETVMKPLFNKPSFANMYLTSSGAPAPLPVADAPAEGASEEQGATPEVTEAQEEDAAPQEPCAAEDLIAPADAPNAEEGEEADDGVVPDGPVVAVCEMGDPDAEQAGEAAPEEEEEPQGGQEEELEAEGDVVCTNVVRSCYTGSGKDKRLFVKGLDEQVPCFTEDRRKAAFALLDRDGKGVVGREEIIAFIRAHEPYSDSFRSDEDLLRWALTPYITKRSDLSAEGSTPLEASCANDEPAVEAASTNADGSAAEGTVAARPVTPRVDVSHLYYRPGSGGKRLDSGRVPLEVGYELFCLVALKLVKA